MVTKIYLPLGETRGMVTLLPSEDAEINVSTTDPNAAVLGSNDSEQRLYLIFLMFSGMGTAFADTKKSLFPSGEKHGKDSYASFENKSGEVINSFFSTS